MYTSRIFDAFSRRSQASGLAIEELPATFRYRILKFCTKVFHDNPSSYHRTDSRYFWSEMHQQLQILIGRPIKPKAQHDIQIVLTFLADCTSADFLDFMELIFKNDSIWRLQVNLWRLIEDFNEFFIADHIPYAMTEFCDATGFYSHGSILQSNVRPKITAYPQIIRRDNEIVHDTAIKPTLTLLRQSGFASANKEFLEALADYRSGDFDDCVAKCGSSFESVMKIICASKEWPYQENNTAETLLDTIMSRTKLKPFFKHSMMSIASIRNSLVAHMALVPNPGRHPGTLRNMPSTRRLRRSCCSWVRRTLE